MIDVIGRILFSLVFLIGAWKHLIHSDEMGQYAASRGVFGGRFLSYLSGVMLLLGGVSLLTGSFVRYGSLLLLLFLIPTTILMHRFWRADSPLEKQQEKWQFYKNIALIGALISYFSHGVW